IDAPSGGGARVYAAPQENAPRRHDRSGTASMLIAMAVATLTFGDRLASEVERKRSQLVVGLDPMPDLLPVELRGDVARFCCGIVDAVAPYAVACRPQLAFFEALGAEGIAAFTDVCGYARRAGLLVIADGKRGDIGSTPRADAAAYPPAGETSRESRAAAP